MEILEEPNEMHETRGFPPVKNPKTETIGKKVKRGLKIN
jgi:hypothetical protein